MTLTPSSNELHPFNLNERWCGSKVVYLIFSLKIRVDNRVTEWGWLGGRGEGVLLDELKGALITGLPPQHPPLNLCYPTPTLFGVTPLRQVPLPFVSVIALGRSLAVDIRSAVLDKFSKSELSMRVTRFWAASRYRVIGSGTRDRVVSPTFT